MTRLSHLSVLAGACLLVAASVTLAGCSDDGDDSGTGGDGGSKAAQEEPTTGPGFGAAEMPTWEPDLEGTMVLGDIAAEDIAPTCDELATVLTDAEGRVACRVVAVAETDDAAECSASVETCLDDPTDALTQSEVTASPDKIDCANFTSEAVAGCGRTIDELVVCIDALSQSLVSASEAVACDQASAIADLEAANTAARFEQDVVGYVQACKPIQEDETCADLLVALLGG